MRILLCLCCGSCCYHRMLDKNNSVCTLSTRREVFKIYFVIFEEIRQCEIKFNLALVTATTSDFLLELVGESIRKKDTDFSTSITPEEKLLVT